MDAWNADQLKRMQLGGNGKLNAFLEQYGIPKSTDIKDKYNSKAAEFYREKIRAEVDGRSYTPPLPSDVRSSVPRAKSYGGPKTVSHDWDSWGDDQHSSSSTTTPHSNEYSLSQLQASAAAKDDFFARRMAENASRPEGLPPSQGGKYIGFGSTPAPSSQANRPMAGTGNMEDVTEMFQKGLSGLGTLAGQAAHVAREKAEHMNLALKEAGVTETIGQATAVAAEKTKEYGAKGWTLLKSAYAAAASTIESTAAQQGIKVDLGSKKVADSTRPIHPGGGRYAPVGGPAPDGYADDMHGSYDSYNNSYQQHYGHDRSINGNGGGGYGNTDGYEQQHRNAMNGYGGGGGGGFSGFDDGYSDGRTSNKNEGARNLMDEDSWGGENDGWKSAPKTTSSMAKGAQQQQQHSGEWTGWEDGGASPGGGRANDKDDWGKW